MKDDYIDEEYYKKLMSFIDSFKDYPEALITRKLLDTSIALPSSVDFSVFNSMIIDLRKRLWNILINNYIQSREKETNKKIKNLYFIIDSGPKTLLLPIYSNNNYISINNFIKWDFSGFYFYLTLLLPTKTATFYNSIAIELYTDNTIRFCIENLIDTIKLEDLMKINSLIFLSDIDKIELDKLLIEIRYFYNVQFFKAYENGTIYLE